MIQIINIGDALILAKKDQNRSFTAFVAVICCLFFTINDKYQPVVCEKSGSRSYSYSCS